MRPVRYIILLVIASALVPATWAQEVVPSASEVREAYDALRFDDVMALGARLIAGDGVPNGDREAVHRLMALVSFARQQPTVASKHIQSALLINPDITFDTSEASPTFVEFFEGVKEAFVAALPPATTEQQSLDESQAVRYIPDRRAPAALRSMIVPGWGQLHKGERSKGTAVAVTWLGLSAVSVAASLQRVDAQRAYEEERDLLKIEQRYDEFSSWHRRRNIAFGATGVVWLYAFLDALVGGSAAPVTGSSLRATPVLIGPHPGVRLSLQF